jgi:hypothetical protein
MDMNQFNFMQIPQIQFVDLKLFWKTFIHVKFVNINFLRLVHLSNNFIISNWLIYFIWILYLINLFD